MDFLQSWVVILNKVTSRSSLVSIRVKTLSNTNLVTSRHIKRDEDLLLVYVCRSKTSLLKLPHDCLHRLSVNGKCERKQLYVFSRTGVNITLIVLEETLKEELLYKDKQFPRLTGRFLT